MKTHQFFVLLITAFSQINCFGQDIVIFNSGSEREAKVLEVTASEIKYKRFDNLTGPTYIVPKIDITMIRFENGTKEVFQPSTSSGLLQTVQQKTQESKSLLKDSTAAALITDIRTKAIQDAQKYYQGELSGAGWTLAATLITTPILGAIPAAFCTSKEPAIINLNFPNYELMKNPAYSLAYRQEAFKIKRNTILTYYGTGTVIFFTALSIVIGSRR